VRAILSVARAQMPPALGFIPLIIFIAGWELMVDKGDSPFFPPPSQWFEEMSGPRGDDLVTNLAATLKTVVAGLLIATVIGAVVGIAIGVSKIARRALSTLLEFLRTLPAPTIIPIALLAFGPGEKLKIFAVAFTTVWPVLLNTASGAGSIHPTLVDMSRTLHLSRFEHIRKVVLPSTVPYILLGMRVALPIAVIIAVLTEMLVSTPGIGRDLIAAQRDYRAASAFGLLFVLGLFGYLLNAAFVIIEGLILRRWPVGANDA
jgi:ABC-type nitrate/sulfonate/bicarbonate transport system permease component